MGRESIQSLLVLLVVSHAVKIFGGMSLMYFGSNAMSGDLGSPGQGIAYLSYISYFLHMLPNIAVGYWLFTVTSSQKLLWLMLGLLVNWWALVIYFAQELIVGSEKNA